MSMYSALPGAVAIYVLTIGGLVIFSKRTKANLAFFFLCAVTFEWVGAWAILFSFPQYVNLLLKVGSTGVILLPTAYFHYILLSTQSRFKVVYGYLTSLFFVILLHTTPYFISGYYVNRWGLYPKAGILHPVFLLYVTVVAWLALLEILKKIKNTQGAREVNQLKYIALAEVAYLLAGIDFLNNYGMRQYPCGFLFVAGFITITTVAILKYRLMDIRLAMRQLLYFVLLGLYFIGGAVLIFCIPLPISIRVLLFFLVGFGFDRVRPLLMAISSKLYASAFVYEKALSVLPQELYGILDAKELESQTTMKIQDAMQLKKIKIELDLSTISAIAAYWKTEAAPLLSDALKSRKDGSAVEAIVKEMETQDWELALPLMKEGNLAGALLLGDKKSNELFSEEDIRLLTLVTRAFCTALLNAESYQKVQTMIADHENILKNLSTGLMVIAPDKTIKTINAKAEEILGVTAEAVVNRVYSEVWTSEDADLIGTSLSTGRTYIGREAVLKVAACEGKVAARQIADREVKVAVRVSVEAMEENGVPAGVMVTLVNLVQLEELKAMIKRAELNFNFQAQLSKMALEVAHKVNNPLQTISSYNDLMAFKFSEIKAMDDDQKLFIQSGFEEIQKASDRIRQAVNELKQSAGPIELNLSMVDVQSLCREALEKAKEHCERRKLHINERFGKLDLLGDRALLAQSLFELLTQCAEDCVIGETLTIQSKTLKETIQLTIQYPTNALTFLQRERLRKDMAALTYSARDDNMGYGIKNAEGIIAAHGGVREVEVMQTKDGFQMTITVTLPKKPGDWVPQPEAVFLPAQAQKVLHEEKKAKLNILIIDDEMAYPMLLKEVLQSYGYRSVEIVHSGEDAVRYAKIKPIRFAIVDIRMKGMDGFQTIEYLKEIQPEIVFVVISATAVEGTDYPVRAGQLGVKKFLPKPFDYLELLKELEGLIVVPMEEQGKAAVAPRFGYLIGESLPMRQVYARIERCAENDTPVLILGENGTGKELVAKAIHEQSERRALPFIAVNCSAIPKELMESELFGYMKGAFTGANADKKGFFEQANGGTIFLDEIGTLPLELQVKLLRVLQPEADGQRRITPVGGQAREIDVRIISATNEDVNQAVTEKRLREDFLHRIMVMTVELPPLRERGEDILLLAEGFLGKCNERHKKEKRFAPETKKVLMAYRWPGNVRELEHTIERMVIGAPGEVIYPVDFTSEFRAGRVESLNLREGMDRLEKELIEKALGISGGNLAQAGEALGIPASTLRDKLKKHEIS